MPKTEYFYVNLYLMGGNGGPSSPIQGSYEDEGSAGTFYNLTIPATIPIRKDYEFLGWTRSSIPTVNDTIFLPGHSYNNDDGLPFYSLYAQWIQKWFNPIIKNIKCYRSDLNGMASDEGSNIYVEFDWETYAPVKNIQIYTARENVSDSGITHEGGSSFEGTSGKYSNLLPDIFSPNFSYTVYIFVVDLDLRDSSTYKFISNQYFTMDFLNGGKGVAIGKPAYRQGFDVGGKTFLEELYIGENDLKITGNSTLLSIYYNDSSLFEINNSALDISFFDSNFAISGGGALERCRGYINLYPEGIGPSWPVNGGYIDFHREGFGTDTTSRIIDSDGFFQITTDHFVRIDLVNAGYGGQLRINPPSGESGIGLYTNNTMHWVLGKGCGGTGDDFGVWSSQGSRLCLRINPSGDLDVSGALITRSSIEIYPGSSSAGHGGFIDFHYNNSSSDYTSRIIEWSDSLQFMSNKAIRLLSANYGIQVNHNGGWPLVVPMNGNSGITNKIDLGNSDYRFKRIYLTTSPNVSSDGRLKRDIKNLDDAIAYDFINNLDVISYNYLIDDPSFKKRIGILANQMVDVNSEFADYFVDDDGSVDKMLSLRNSDLVFPLIQCIKHLSKKIDILESKISI